MPTFIPAELAAWTHGTWVGTTPREIAGFGIDTRALKPGECFIAIRTERRDGHDFLAAAKAAGAAAALVQQVDASVDLPQLVVADPVMALQECARAHRARFSGIVIGVTGSAGKTSTKEMLRAVLAAEGVLATEGNLNNTFGVPLTLLRVEDRSHRFAVIEAGINQPGEMALLADMIRPNVGLVTNVGPAHLELLGSLEGVATEKVKLLERVSGDGFIVYPVDCESFPEFSALPGQKRVVGSTTEPGANVFFQAKLQNQAGRSGHATERSLTAWPRSTPAIELRLDLPRRPGFALELPPFSEGMVQNAALVLTTALSLGLDPVVVSKALEAWRPGHHRGEVRRVGAQTFYLDCYNANPLSMRDAMTHFDRLFPEGPRLFVLGSMRELGAMSATAHRQIGETVPHRGGDRVIFIGEGAAEMAAGARKSGLPSAHIVTAATTEEAAERVSTFEGAIFLKGSRAFRLESLLPKEEGVPC